MNFKEIYELNNKFYQYLGAVNELAERDIDYDAHYYIVELKEICKALNIANKFNWYEIFEDYENGGFKYEDEIFKIEDRVSEILKSKIYGVD